MVRSSERRRSGSARMSSATTFPPLTVKAPTENATPSRVVTAPATPLTSAGCVNRPNWAKTIAWRATWAAPRTGPDVAGGAGGAGRTGRDRALVGSHHHVGVEDGEERLEVAVARRGQERVDHFALALHVDVGNGRLALNAPAGPAGQLARRLGRPFDDWGDLVEGHRKDVVQDEGQPFRRSERLEHHEERNPDRVGQERLVLGVGPARTVQDHVGHVRLQRVLAPGAAGAQDVQRHPGDHGRQPGPQVLHLRGVGAVEANPCLLDGVVGLAERAEHPVGHGAQVGPLLLEACGLVGLIVHGCTVLRCRPSVQQTRRTERM